MKKYAVIVGGLLLLVALPGCPPSPPKTPAALSR